MEEKIAKKKSAPKGLSLSVYDKQKIKMETLRTKLAVKQTEMACERSLLSYIRTACVFVSLAFTYLKVASHDNFDWFVIVMFAIGTAFLIFGIVEYKIILRKQRNLSRHLTEEYLMQDNIDFDDTI